MNRSAVGKTDTKLAERLIEVGERLLGSCGIQGVSLRQISTAAGTRNNYAVQYHFGDIDGLIRGILSKRNRELELRRADLLSHLKTGRRPATRELLEVFYRPFFDNIATASGPVQARFILTLLSTPEGWKPLDETFGDLMITRRIIGLLREANPKLPERVIWQRLRRVSVMVLSVTCTIEYRKKLSRFYEAMIVDALDMGAAALSAPLDDAGAILVKDADKYFAR